jgi:DNA-binding CsgD family transcriptional regulator
MSTLEDGLLIQLIDGVYSAAIDPSRWADVAAALGVAFRAQVSLMLGFDSSQSRVLYAELWGLPPEALTPYENTYAALDIRMPPALRAPAGTVVTDETLVDRTTYHASAIYNEYLRPIDCDHLMGVVLPCNAADMQVIVSLNRSRRTGAFEAQERVFLQRLVPHIQRAVLMSAKLVTADNATRLLSDLMNRVHFGVLTLAKDGRVADANPIAAQILRDGDALTQVAGRLMAVSRSANDSLQRAIGSTLRYIVERQNINVDPVVVPRASGSPLRLLLAPLATSARAFRAADSVLVAFVFSADTGPSVCPKTLSLVYGFTPAEARVAAKLAEGHSLTEIASVLSISIETVRTHIKRVFSRTHCDSQTSLVREILLGPTQSLESTGNDVKN